MPAPRRASAPSGPGRNDTGVVPPAWSERVRAAWAADEAGGSRTVLEVLASAPDSVDPDELARVLRRLGASGVTLRLTPRSAPNGHAAISWRQDGRQRTAEGSTLGVAFRRALKALSARSGGCG